MLRTAKKCFTVMPFGEMILTPEQRDAWLNFVKLTSVPLRHIADSGLPDSVASGCIVEHQGRKFVLSVSHATVMGGNWAAEVRYEPGKGTQLYRFGATYFLSEHSLSNGSGKEVDFSYSEVHLDFDSWFQELSRSGSILNEEERVGFKLERIQPDPNEVFAFAGQVRTEIHMPDAVVSDMVVYPGLKFERSEGGDHIFRLPVPHPGHEAFKGCSGAPVVDTQRRVVGLVSRGCEKENTITATSLS